MNNGLENSSNKTWTVKNISSSQIAFGDLPQVPAITPGKTCDLLRYVGQDLISTSVDLVKAIQLELVTFTKIQVSQTTTDGSSTGRTGATVTTQSNNYNVKPTDTFVTCNVTSYSGDVNAYLPTPSQQNAGQVVTFYRIDYQWQGGVRIYYTSQYYYGISPRWILTMACDGLNWYLINLVIMDT